MITWFIIAAVLLGGALIAMKVGQSSPKKPKALPAPSTRTLLTMQVNDIVTHFDADYICEGKLTFKEDGDEWYEYMLVDGSRTVWLSVEEDDRLEVGLFEEVDDLKFTSKPPEQNNTGVGHLFSKSPNTG